MNKEFEPFIWENLNKEFCQEHSSMPINLDLRIIALSEEECNDLDICPDKIKSSIKMAKKGKF